MASFSLVESFGIIPSRLYPRQSVIQLVVPPLLPALDFPAPLVVDLRRRQEYLLPHARCSAGPPPVSSARKSERLGGQDAESCPRHSRRVPLDFARAHV